MTEPNRSEPPARNADRDSRRGRPSIVRAMPDDPDAVRGGRPACRISVQFHASADCEPSGERHRCPRSLWIRSDSAQNREIPTSGFTPVNSPIVPCPPDHAWNSMEEMTG